METPTTRLGMLKPDTLEFVDVDDHLNDNWDIVDKAIGLQMVNDGADAVKIYDGAIIREKTSGKEYLYKSDGLGGFNKIIRTVDTLGVINHYTATIVAASIGTAGVFSLPANGWQTISGTSKGWVSDRTGWAQIRAVLDVIPGHTPATLQTRLSGFATSESVPFFPSSGTRLGIECSMVFQTVAGTTHSFSLDGYSFTGGSLTAQALRWYVDTNSVLT